MHDFGFRECCAFPGVSANSALALFMQGDGRMQCCRHTGYRSVNLRPHTLIPSFCLSHFSSMRLASNGVIKRLYRQQYSARPFGNDVSTQQIDIQAASPLLVVLGAGVLLSVLLFAGELTANRLSPATHTGRYSETVPSARGRPIQKGYERRPLKKGKMRIKLKTEASEVNKMFSEAFIRKCISE